MKKFRLLLLCLLPVCVIQAQSPDDLNFRYAEITLPKLMQKMEKGEKDFIILDVRTKGEYHDTLSTAKHLNIGHIKGAINIPLQDLQRKPEALQQLDPYKDKEIYVICSQSYRSRIISKLLLEKNFKNITNVKGGMSEWYRNYDEMKPFASSFYENKIGYKNISPSQLYNQLKNNDPVLFIGFKNAPRNWFDSVVVSFYQHFPDLKNAEYFTSADSAAVLSKAKKASGKNIVVFNTIGMGAGEMANWLTQNGITNVHYLVGNLPGFYEYMVNYQPTEKKAKYFSSKNKIQFYSGLNLCRSLEQEKSLQLIDLRHDTIFTKPTVGTKLTYHHLRGAINFPYYRSVDEFVKQFPDKNKEYVLLPHQGYVGMELTDALLNKGYKIGWLIGGNERWEWYTNNMETFSCSNFLVQ